MQQQPTKQQQSAQQRQSISKGRSTERTAGKAAESAANYKERLLKGYQYQLNGDYDEAMQEYRLIIRGAPELLSEVISNVRALLKLAPKYSLGYRILGDAYMRQGEYLQAMEAYNKALTMAKKAKSQAS
jgi:tetratricopeptide (TPR) repeat protein